MWKNRIFYALFLAVCLAFSMLYTSGISQILLIVAVAYPFAAAGLTAIQAALMSADFTEKRVVVLKNTAFEFGISVKNGSLLPCVPVELVCSLPDMDSGRFVRKRIYVSLSPLAKAKLVVEGRHLYRGCYTAAVESVSAVDPLRIIRISRKIGTEMTMVFLPRKLSLEAEVLSSVGEQSFSKPSAITVQPEDFSHVRDYRAGDNSRLLHWKLTAKQDSLMIKQYDSADDRRMFVICDRSSGTTGDSFLCTDTVIETALAFVKTALDEGINSAVQTGEEVSPLPVTNYAEYDTLYDIMATLPVKADGTPEEFIELIDETDLSGAAAVVLITANLTEEIIFRAEEFAKSGEAYLVFVNTGDKPVENKLYEQPFMFLNLRGSGEEALKLAVAMAKATE